MVTNVKAKGVFISVVWSFLERSGTHFIQFIIQIVLARLLLPEEFGVISLLLILIHFADILVQSGFSTSLIQKKNSDELDYSSVFYLSFVISLLIFSIVYILSTVFSSYFNIFDFDRMIKITSIAILFSPVISLQKAYAIKNFRFRLFLISSTFSVTISGLLGIYLASNDYGVWSLIYQNLTNQFVNMILLWFLVKWRPKAIFSFHRIKTLFNFGSKILLSSLLDAFERDARSIVIGKFYSPYELGIYNRGNSFPMLIVGNINSSIQSVLFPVLSIEQNNFDKLKYIVKKALQISLYIVAPLMFGMFILAEEIIVLVLTEKWLEATVFLKIGTLTFMMWPFHTVNLQLISAIGRSDIYLKLELIKKTFSIIILVATAFISIQAIAYGLLISGIFSLLVNSIPTKKYLNYGIIDQLKDNYAILGFILIMFISITAVDFLPLNNILMLFLKVLAGGISYIAVSFIFKYEPTLYIYKLILSLFKKKYYSYKKEDFPL